MKYSKTYTRRPVQKILEESKSVAINECLFIFTRKRPGDEFLMSWRTRKEEFMAEIKCEGLLEGCKFWKADSFQWAFAFGRPKEKAPIKFFVWFYDMANKRTFLSHYLFAPHLIP